jgi:ribosomal protein S18 acetylase RimI-like enzyme
MQLSEHHPYLKLRRLSSQDLPSIVEIHIHAFPSSAMSRLGTGTLYRYYDWQLNGPHDAHAIGAVVGGNLVGFCVGGVFRSAVAGFVRRNRWYLARQVLMRPQLLAGPLFRDRLRRGLTIMAAPAERGVKHSRSFRLLVIAVDPAAQSTGVGSALMQAAEKEAIARSFGQMHLGVHPANLKAIGFYEWLGWSKVDSPDSWQGMRKDLNRELSPRFAR